MNIKRYFGRSAREALQALKAELGADAIVLSNRAVEGGVEIIALPADAVGSLSNATAAAKKPPQERARPRAAVSQAPVARPAPASAQATKPAPRAVTIAERYGGGGEVEAADYRVSLQQAQRAAAPRRAAPPRAAAPQQAAPQQAAPQQAAPQQAAPQQAAPQQTAPQQTAPQQAAPQQTAPQQAAPQQTAPKAAPRGERRASKEAPAVLVHTQQNTERIRALQADNARLMEELDGIRGMIERQLAGFAWNETRRSAPARAQILGELLQAGLAPALAQDLGSQVQATASLEDAREQARELLSRRLRLTNADTDLIDQGGVYALVGPTGVGKTTTAAKIAARAVVRHGASRLALITTDGYRIGAQEQLRIYGRILGVPVFPVRDGHELQRALHDLRDKHLVLIDTMGMSQRDRMVAQQAAMLAGAGSVRRLLLLNATCRGDTLEDVIRAWKGPDLAGCVLTKTDEAVSLAPALGATLMGGLNVYYLTNGQRVPEDLHLPNRAYLLNRALHVAGADSPWRMAEEDTELLLAANME